MIITYTMLQLRIAHLSMTVATAACLMLLLSSTPVQAQESMVLYNTQDTKDNNYWTPELYRHAQPQRLEFNDLLDIRKMTEELGPDATVETQETGLSEGQSGRRPSLVVEPDWNNRLFEVPKRSELSKNADDAITQDVGTGGAHYSSSRVFPPTLELVYPYRAVGKLFFRFPNGVPGVCTAAVVSFRLVVTSGGCVHQGVGGQSGFHTNFRFVPAYREGAAPLGDWEWERVLVTSTWFNGGGDLPNAADYALLEMRDQTVNGETRRIGDITGFFGWRTLSLLPNHVHMFGYPLNLDRGEIMQQVTGQSLGAVVPNNVVYGSDMRAGAGGGPFVQNFGRASVGQPLGANPLRNTIVGVFSFFNTPPAFHRQGGSIFDVRFINLYNDMCDNRVGNCP